MTDGSVPYYVCGYRLEGDGPIACLANDEIEFVTNTINFHTVETYPNVLNLVNEALNSIAEDASNEIRNVEKAKWEEFVLSRINRGRDYFQRKFIQIPHPLPTSTSNCFGHLMPMWKAMALSNPDFLRRKSLELPNNDEMMVYVRQQLQVLVSLNRISMDLRDRCIGSFGSYFTQCKLIDYSTLNFEIKANSIQEFWINHRLDYRNWYEFAIICFLHQPSSCAAERVFSILKYILTAAVEDSLDDYIKAAVYGRYENS